MIKGLAIPAARVIVAASEDSINMGIININAANSTETSTEGNNDTSSCDKDIITIIHAEYEVN
jgi:hypothetical protein